MRARTLRVEGAYEFSPHIHRDDRGLFVSTFQEEAFVRAIGRRLFTVAQASQSRSRRGAVRGVHYTLTPPGSAKYVYCARGLALDIVVDLRTGSPTFGRWDTVLLDPEHFRAVYLPVGLGHAYVALQDGTAMCYLLSATYVPEHELALSVLDPELGLPIPGDIEPILSERDAAAPTLAEVRAAGGLPEYATCLGIEAALLPPAAPA